MKWDYADLDCWKTAWPLKPVVDEQLLVLVLGWHPGFHYRLSTRDGAFPAGRRAVKPRAKHRTQFAGRVLHEGQKGLAR